LEKLVRRFEWNRDECDGGYSLSPSEGGICLARSESLSGAPHGLEQDTVGNIRDERAAGLSAGRRQ